MNKMKSKASVKWDFRPGSLVFVAVLAASLACCSGNPADPGAEAAPCSPESASASRLEDVNGDNFRSFPESDASDFSTYGSDDGLVINGCSSDDRVVVVPSEINGIKVTGIDDRGMALLECEAIVLPDTVLWIGEDAFDSCRNLKYVWLGESVQDCGELMFNACVSLGSVYFPGSVVSLRNPFAASTAIKDVYISGSTTDIKSIGFIELTPNIVIHTPAGSIAEQVAAEQGLPVVNDY